MKPLTNYPSHTYEVHNFLSKQNVLRKTLNYKFLEESMSIINEEELIAASMHPKRTERHLQFGSDKNDFSIFDNFSYIRTLEIKSF